MAQPSENWIESMRSLLDDPSPAALTTYREDGSALVSPVWFRWYEEAFEVIVEGDAGPVRAAIAGRYLGARDGARFAAERTKAGVVLRLSARAPRVWDLAGILPT